MHEGHEWMCVFSLTQEVGTKCSKYYYFLLRAWNIFPMRLFMIIKPLKTVMLCYQSTDTDIQDRGFCLFFCLLRHWNFTISSREMKLCKIWCEFLLFFNISFFLLIGKSHGGDLWLALLPIIAARQKRITTVVGLIFNSLARLKKIYAECV